MKFCIKILLLLFFISLDVYIIYILNESFYNYEIIKDIVCICNNSCEIEALHNYTDLSNIIPYNCSEVHNINKNIIIVEKKLNFTIKIFGVLIIVSIIILFNIICSIYNNRQIKYDSVLVVP